MFRHLLVLIGVLAVLCCGVPVASAAEDALEKAFEALKTYDWGKERAPLRPLEEAVAAAGKDPALAKALEQKLVGLLKADVSQAAKDQICRQLSLVGSAECVPAVAELLPDEKLSHMARYVLERIPAPEATKALRDALPKTKGVQKVGVLNSLGVKRDAESVPALVPLLADSDHQVAAAAAAALGAIGNSEAAKALADFQAKGSSGTEAGRRRCVSGLCRGAAGRRQKDRSPGHLQRTDQVRNQARQAGCHTGHDERHGQEAVSRAAAR